MVVIRILALCLAATGMCFGQGANVRWQFSDQQVSSREHLLMFKASILPSWHLYSHNLQEGGPAPTRIYFDDAEGYQVIGTLAEKGEAITFYDSTYEMEITWYASTVTFLQRVVVNQRPITIRGYIEYMTCNTQVCQVFREPFAIVVRN